MERQTRLDKMQDIWERLAEITHLGPGGEIVPIGIVVLGLVAGGVALAHKDVKQVLPVKSVPCEAVNTSGKKVEPLAYPLGNITLNYENYNNGYVFSSVGVAFKNSANQYSVVIHNMGKSNLWNADSDFSDTNAAVWINTPQTGEVGFTLGCVQFDSTSNNLPATVVEMPTTKS